MSKKNIERFFVFYSYQSIKWIVLIAIVCLFHQSSFAQSQVRGRVVDNLSSTKIASVQIKNLSSNLTTISDTLGEFKLTAKAGDLIIATNSNYLTDTVYLVNLKYQEVRLVRRDNKLNEVIVKGSAANSGAFFYVKPLSPIGGSVIRYQTDATAKPIGGLRFNVFDSHKDARRRNRDQNFETDMKQEAEIKRAFRPEVVKKYLPLKDSDVIDFIRMYTPNAKKFYDNKFNMLEYLSKSYKAFLKVPAAERKVKDDLRWMQ